MIFGRASSYAYPADGLFFLGRKALRVGMDAVCDALCKAIAVGGALQASGLSLVGAVSHFHEDAGHGRAHRYTDPRGQRGSFRN